MTSTLQFPTPTTPFLDASGMVSQVWLRFLLSITKAVNSAATPAQPPVTVPITPSPFIYIAPSDGFLVISGNGVAQVQMQRSATGYVAMGQHYGPFPMKSGDAIKVTYPNGSPKLTFFGG